MISQMLSLLSGRRSAFAAVIITSLATFAARADENVATLFSEANRLYEQGHYREAAESYRKLIDTGHGSAALWFNLGNACFQSGEAGHAIAAYRIAQKLAPRDPDIRANLHFARREISGDHLLKDSWWSKLLQKLTLNEWALLFAAALWIWFALLIAGELRPAWKANLRLYVLPAGALSLLMALCLAAAVYVHSSTRHSVVVAREAVARRGPFDESQTVFTARDGVELIVLDRRTGWVQVADAASQIGWMREDQLMELTAR